MTETVEDQIKVALEGLIKDHVSSDKLDEIIAKQVAEIISGKANVSKRIPMSAIDGEHKDDFGNKVPTYAPGEFKSFGEFCVAVARGDPRVTEKALFESDGSTGGFLVPDEFRATILQTEIESAVMRPGAFILPMAGPSLTMPVLDDTNHTNSLFGGVIAFWEGEGDTFTETQPVFKGFQLIAYKLTGLTAAGNEMMMDSPVSLDALLTQMFGKAITWFEDKAFLTGSGAGQPKGLNNAGAMISVDGEVGQASDEFLPINIYKMSARLLPSSMNRAVWIANPTIKPALYNMNQTVGTGGAPAYIPAGALANSPSDSLMGRPIIYTEHQPALGTVGDLTLADRSYYVIGDRMALTVASSAHVRFTSDQTMWRFVQRVGGAPWLNSAITPENGDTLSPFVNLATRS